MRTHQAFTIVMLLVVLCGAGAPDLSVTAEPYLTGGVFAKPLLPHEGQDVTLTVRASVVGQIKTNPDARVTIVGATGKTVAQQTIRLTRRERSAEGTWTWKASTNGLYKARVEIDPSGRIRESDETNNVAELALPVVVQGRTMHFAWYREVPTARWTTCVTSANDAKQRARLAERGVVPLNWAYGGASWRHYDKDKAQRDPEGLLEDIENLFFEKYTAKSDACFGMGVDEIGGYPGTFAERISEASMKGLVRAKRKMPDRFFAVWHGGGVTLPLAQQCRKGADLFLLETYVWRAIPDALGAEDIYRVIFDRLEPFIRSHDMFQPAYGNWCYTLIALDTSERPDYIDLGEQEQVVRYIRRLCPEMRGIAWYNGGYGGYGVTKTPEFERHHQAVLAGADRLCLDYYVKPCLTLMPQSLWLGRSLDGSWTLTAAVSNIGGMDSGPVSVAFYVDGHAAGKRSASKVPAGPSRNANRVLLAQPVQLSPGPHAFEARIVAAGTATVLDPIARCSRMVR